jgi:hypothetical protein
MNSNATNQINARIFVGLELNFEIKKKLNESHLWKDAKIVGGTNPKSLKEVQYQGKKYIGRLLPFNEVTLKDLDKEAKEVLEKLSEFCPLLKLEKNSTLVFPQVFVA